MNKQIVVSLIAASLIGASATAFGENERNRNGGWRIDGDHVQTRKQNHYGKDHHKGKGKGDKSVVIKKKHARHKGKPDKIIVIKEQKPGKHKHKPDKVVIIKEPVHHRHDRDDGVDDRYWRKGLHFGAKYAKVLKVKPIRQVTKRIRYRPSGKCRYGDHSFGAYESGPLLELMLGGLRIKANKHHDCKRIVKEVDTDYRVTYRYKGKKHVVHMNNHPGNYVRVNRFGEPVPG